MPPRVFIASSSYHERLVRYVVKRLSMVSKPFAWIEGKKEFSSSIHQWVASLPERCDYGIFVLAPDPRWGGQVNGNVLLELGVFLSSRGLPRCLLLTSDDAKLPRDLDGLIVARYNRKRFEQEGGAALTEVCEDLARAVVERRSFAEEIRGVWLETKEAGKKEGLLSLVHFDLKGGGFKIRGRSYDGAVNPTFSWPYQVDYCWVPDNRSEVYHTFDALCNGRHRVLGVTYSRFDNRYSTGDGHFVVSGYGGIYQGMVQFSLRKIGTQYLQELGVGSSLDFDDIAQCSRFVHAVLRRQGRSRVKQATAGRG